MLNILVKSLKHWFYDDPFTQSAAAAYYAIFSIPGLMIIIMTVASLFFDQQHVEEEILSHIRGVLGPETANSIDKIVDESQRTSKGLLTMVIGAVTLMFGATGLFVQLQRSLNHIWDIEVRETAGWGAFLKRRLVSLGLILIIGFLMLVSLTLTTIVTVLEDWISEWLLMEGWSLNLYIVHAVASFLMIAFLFTLIFKILPDVKIRWTPCFLGGLLSAFLFRLGEYALNLYFDMADNPFSSYGAASSVILIMLWVSYSCMTLLIGAEFSKTYANEKEHDRGTPDSEIAKRRKK